jgi:hypothetical protein
MIDQKNTFYTQRTHFTLREHILHSENTFCILGFMPPKKPEPSLSSYAQVIKATEVRRSVPKKRDIPPLPSPEKKNLKFLRGEKKFKNIFWKFFFQ